MVCSAGNLLKEISVDHFGMMRNTIKTITIQGESVEMEQKPLDWRVSSRMEREPKQKTCEGFSFKHEEYWGLCYLSIVLWSLFFSTLWSSEGVVGNVTGLEGIRHHRAHWNAPKAVKDEKPTTHRKGESISRVDCDSIHSTTHCCLTHTVWLLQIEAQITPVPPQSRFISA